MKGAKVYESLLTKTSENIVITAIRRGLLYMMPLVLVGSFVLVLLNLPIDAFQNMMDALFTEKWTDIALSIYKGTFQIMSITALLSVSYALCLELPLFQSGELNSLVAIITSFSAFIAFEGSTDAVIDLDSAGSTGMFWAILIAISSTYLFTAFYRLMPKRTNIYAYDADALLISSLRCFPPILMTVFSFALLRGILNWTGFFDMLSQGGIRLSDMFLAGRAGIATLLLYNFVSHILWFFGMHGTNMLEVVSRDIFVEASTINIDLAAAGTVPTQVMTKEFFDVFVYMGGAGCTLGLVVALLFAGRASNVNRIARYSLLPGLFNINEIMIYGLPIIFNPYYLAPFLITPMVLSLTSYAAFSWGLVPLTVARVEWTTPIFISGYISTGGAPEGIALQAVNLVLAALIYLPFIRLYERQLTRNNKATFQKLTDSVAYVRQVKTGTALLSRNDELGVIARSLATEIREALGGADKGLCLEYQPKVDAQGCVCSAEALLRWYHPVYGYMPPPVVLAIADEAGMTVELGNWVMRTALGELGRWHRLGYNKLGMAVNLSPKQLREDARLTQRVQDAILDSGVDACRVELELTENEAVDQSEATRKCLETVRDMGIRIAIDDFGMGNSSLLYLRDLYASVVKIDMSLVQAIADNQHSQEIVRSILLLCRQLDVEVVAEGVETDRQLELLRECGCTIFQGFYYSCSLSGDMFIEHVQQVGASGDESE